MNNETAHAITLTEDSKDCGRLFLLNFLQLNLLVATKVGEEGLDIQTCCLVIRFDLPESVSSFIQSRGRARMPKSEYIFLVDRYFSACYFSL